MLSHGLMGGLGSGSVTHACSEEPPIARCWGLVTDLGQLGSPLTLLLLLNLSYFCGVLGMGGYWPS